MDSSAQKEEFSRAYVHAVATVAGFTQYEPEVDDDSIDVGFAARGGGGTVRSPKVDVQLKCTTDKVVFEKELRFPLPIKNYEDLRGEDLQVPRILIVLVVPDDLGEWLEHDETRLVLKRCAWWCSLRDEAPSPNSTNVTIHIPRGQVFNPEALKGIMQRVGERKQP